jgi:small subunit ribosomal protein S16
MIVFFKILFDFVNIYITFAPRKKRRTCDLHNFMATKLRLQRHGRNKKAYYYIVAADSRAPRDGRFIERIGDYNPNTNPATINLDLTRAVKWLDTGAIPTDTVRAILSYKGAMMLHHLHGGVNKGAFTAEDADTKFQNWMTDKETKVQSKRDNLASAKAQSNAEKLKAEGKIKEAKAAAIAAKNAVVEEVPAEEPAAAEETASAEVVNTVQETSEAPAATEETAPAEVVNTAEETSEAPAATEETAPAEVVNTAEETSEAPAAENNEAPAENTEA